MSLLLLLAETAAEATAVDGGWAAWLKEYGGWAISVVLAGAVVYMARYIVTKLEDKADPKEVREAQAIKDRDMYADLFKDMITNLTITITPLITTIENNTGDHEQLRKDLLDALHDQFVPLVAAIKASTVGSVEMKVALQKFFDETAKEKDDIITKLAQQKQEVGDAAMAKMEELYGQMLGMFEKVIGAARTLEAVNDRLLAIEAKSGGDSSERERRHERGTRGPAKEGHTASKETGHPSG